MISLIKKIILYIGERMDWGFFLSIGFIILVIIIIFKGTPIILGILGFRSPFHRL